MPRVGEGRAQDSGWEGSEPGKVGGGGLGCTFRVGVSGGVGVRASVWGSPFLRGCGRDAVGSAFSLLSRLPVCPPLFLFHHSLHLSNPHLISHHPFRHCVRCSPPPAPPINLFLAESSTFLISPLLRPSSSSLPAAPLPYRQLPLLHASSPGPPPFPNLFLRRTSPPTAPLLSPHC